ncbi:hypothetical protein PHMEG_0008598 [Phytophthora megakarya]|uniref:ZSWIM1/3 RNaseH-like domain-containing protein n=1 Tax=Phytophthora megakarya TaxID=4795 RepID=A0A225WJM9_9STRA|nr:hypothetical protein PHMEG_0008598 [Phytophthora megakarya]
MTPRPVKLPPLLLQIQRTVSAVTETEAGETEVISLATAHMRLIFGRFSELLLVDCSHKRNRYNYQ